MRLKRIILIIALVAGARMSAADFVSVPAFSNTDKGLYGRTVGKSRLYFDISLPALTPNLLVDVGMNMSHWDGVLGMAPRWFAMFSPTACPYGELSTTPRSESAIMFTFRTYF
ncbi:MAG: hypothetical protein IJ581_06025 [Paludibacteraceae bacterium]|nr:hypothetical protein [Paludibacteraceae bacterium]